MQFPALGNVTLMVTASVVWNVSFKLLLNSDCWRSLLPSLLQGKFCFLNSRLCGSVLLDKSPPNYQDRKGFFTPATIVVTADNTIFLSSSKEGLCQWEIRHSPLKGAQFSHSLLHKSASFLLLNIGNLSIILPSHFEAIYILPNKKAPGTYSIFPFTLPPQCAQKCLPWRLHSEQKYLMATARQQTMQIFLGFPESSCLTKQVPFRLQPRPPLPITVAKMSVCVGGQCYFLASCSSSCMCSGLVPFLSSAGLDPVLCSVMQRSLSQRRAIVKWKRLRKVTL